jgi:hypothetical protein
MRRTRLIYCLAALIIVSLAAGLIESAHLGASSPRSPSLSGYVQPSGTPVVSSPATDGWRLGDTPIPAAPPAPSVPAIPMPSVLPQGQAKVYVVQPSDTLWDLAGHHLGDPLRWHQLFDLNRGRHQPDGRTFSDPMWIHPGWTLEFPADATGIASSSPAVQPASTGSTSGRATPLATASRLGGARTLTVPVSHARHPVVSLPRKAGLHAGHSAVGRSSAVASRPDEVAMASENPDRPPAVHRHSFSRAMGWTR